jgi:hypothetical protein
MFSAAIRRLLSIAIVVLIALSPALAHAQPAAVTASARAIKSITSFLRRTSPVADDEIVEWASTSARAGGTNTVGQALGSRQLSREVLEDTYLRMVVQQGRIERAEAEAMFARLSGTPGFQETLRKVSGANEKMTVGHRNELRIALAARQQGLEVRGIGTRFDDGLKKGTTDLDVVLGNGRRTVVVEAKAYGAEEEIPLDRFRADMATLNAYARMHPEERVVPVFTLTAVPADPNVWRQFQIAAANHSVEPIVGTPVEQAMQIRQLLEILQ